MKKHNLMILMTSLAMVLSFSACGDDAGPMPPVPEAGMEAGSEGGMEAGVMTPAVPTLGTQIDRTGRPAINTALNNTFNGDAEAAAAAKDAYNADGNVAGWQAAYAGDFATSLAILDSADTMCGNQLLASPAAMDGSIPADRYAALAGILADDRLYMHTDLGFCGYLGLEAWIVGGMMGDPAGCGGRTLGNDVIASSYSVLVAGALDGSIDDTITEDSATHSDTEFPFVAAPAAGM